MKKIILAFALIVILAFPAWGADLKKVGLTTDAAITAGPGYLKGLIIHTDGTNSVTFAIHDSATGVAGPLLFSSLIVTTSAANRVTTLSFDGKECPYTRGLYINITTSGTVTYDVYFESR